MPEGFDHYYNWHGLLEWTCDECRWYDFGVAWQRVGNAGVWVVAVACSDVVAVAAVNQSNLYSIQSTVALLKLFSVEYRVVAGDERCMVLKFLLFIISSIGSSMILRRWSGTC